MPDSPRAGSTEPKGMRTSGCSAARSAISSLDSAGWPVAISVSTLKTTAAMFLAR
jgi:hypothetical protein